MRSFLSWVSGSTRANSREPAASDSAGYGSRQGGAGASARSGSEGRRPSWMRLSSRLSAARARNTAQNDPLRLDPELFEYVTHRADHGEVFVAYRVLGHPMVLHSLVDGLPLASLHLRVARGGEATALVARRPRKGDNEFLGIINSDNQDFELIMTNLTTDTVMMFDIGGASRSREAEYWNRTDASFWTGRHRNDRRLNRSNILWPMTPNACSENNFHFQDHGEHRRLVLRAKVAGGTSPVANAGAQAGFLTEPDTGGEGYPLFVYPKFCSRTADKFARTAWSCPQTILIVGTPALLDGDVREGHNIQVERPQANPRDRTAAQPQNIVDEVAASFGVPTQKFLEVVKVDVAFLEALPRDMQREVMAMALQNADLSALEDEPEPSKVGTPIGRAASSTASARESDDDAAGSTLELGARPAEVAAGRRLLREGAHSLLIEKFDFDRRGADAVLTLGVRDGLQLCGHTQGEVQAEAEESLQEQLDRLMKTRTAELIQDVNTSEIYATPECVICMEGNPPPDTVLYQCGHRCVHAKCVESARLRRCPLCRSLIVALLRVP